MANRRCIWLTRGGVLVTLLVASLPSLLAMCLAKPGGQQGPGGKSEVCLVNPEGVLETLLVAVLPSLLLSFG